MQIAYMTYTVQHFPFQLFKQESICFLLVFLEGLKCKHEDSNPTLDIKGYTAIPTPLFPIYQARVDTSKDEKK